jgi:hypothetical protein
MSNWSVTNDNNDPATVFTYIGSAYDGSANYGTGVIPGGDGALDHMVSKTFHLAAGDYSIFAGGTNYANQSVLLPLQYGISGTVAVVPEPETYAMLPSRTGIDRCCSTPSQLGWLNLTTIQGLCMPANS